MTKDEIINTCIVNDEGGWVFSNWASDPGGATFAGVTLTTFNFYTKYNIDAAEYKHRAEAGALNISILKIYNDIWEKLHLDDFPNFMQAPVFSCGVNQGESRAIKHWQNANNKFQKNEHGC